MNNGLRVLHFMLACSTAILCAAGTQGFSGKPREQRPQRAASAHSSAARVTQEEVVVFPRLGAVRIRAMEAPYRVPRLEFSSATTKRTLFNINLGMSDPQGFKPEDDKSLMNPFVRFMVLRPDGLPQPLILIVAVRPGGSDHTFETTLVGAPGGRLKRLNAAPLLTSLQGGVFVGDLGSGYGVGAASWSFIWEDGVHYGPHRYEVKLFPFDARRAAFGRAIVRSTKGTHRSGAEALKELKLPAYVNLLDTFPAIEDYRH